MTSGAAKGKFPKHAISTLLVGLFFVQLFAPLASASGMASCSGDCDNYDHAEDMTPHQQDWLCSFWYRERRYDICSRNCQHANSDKSTE